MPFYDKLRKEAQHEGEQAGQGRAPRGFIRSSIGLESELGKGLGLQQFYYATAPKQGLGGLASHLVTQLLEQHLRERAAERFRERLEQAPTWQRALFHAGNILTLGALGRRERRKEYYNIAKKPYLIGGLINLAYHLTEPVVKAKLEERNLKKQLEEEMRRRNIEELRGMLRHGIGTREPQRIYMTTKYSSENQPQPDREMVGETSVPFIHRRKLKEIVKGMLFPEIMETSERVKQLGSVVENLHHNLKTNLRLPGVPVTDVSEIDVSTAVRRAQPIPLFREEVKAMAMAGARTGAFSKDLARMTGHAAAILMLDKASKAVGRRIEEQEARVRAIKEALGEEQK